MPRHYSMFNDFGVVKWASKRRWHKMSGGKRCGHPYCDDCKTKRGNNLGNRRQRQQAKRDLRKQED